MQWSLFLLLLMGQCSLVICQRYKYHFVEELKTWHDAQTYCKARNADLATVSDMTSMEQLRQSAQTQTEAWIGLYRVSGKDNREWHWSLPGVKYNDNETNWANKEPNDNYCTLENCGRMDSSGEWKDVACQRPYTFICYNETKLNKTFHFIPMEKKWREAQSYCRESHTDLVSGVKQLENQEVRNMINSETLTWIGLFRDTWRWSDRSNYSYRHWDSVCELWEELHDSQQDTKKCAMTLLNKLGKWSSDDCNKQKFFFCYGDRLILIKQNKTWNDAVKYCRENHHHLVSITNDDEQKWVQEKAKMAEGSFIWLGMRYSCALDLWFWVDDKSVCYENWNSEEHTEQCDISVAMDSREPHTWSKKNVTDTYNFICSLW